MTVLTQNYFNELMQQFDLSHSNRIAVGVSGGADSLCLTLFLSAWAKKNGKELTALTVNHKIRAIADKEANNVHDFLSLREIKHVILTNSQPIPESGLEEYAREIRYTLLTDYCLANKIDTLFLAHHADDQAETFLLRLSKKSGLTGLKAMTPETRLNTIRICRPFLKLSKSVIANTLTEQGITWVEDEMNQDTHYARVRWRQFLPKLKAAGITSEAIGLVSERLARADTALKMIADQFIRQSVWIDFRGFARIPVSTLQTYPFEIQIRVILEMIQRIGQAAKPVSLKSVEELCLRLPCAATLGECVFVPHKTGLYIAKEASRQEAGRWIEPHIPVQWDRFIIISEKECFVRAGVPCCKIENIPIVVQKTFPAVFMQKELEKEIQIDYKEKNDPLIRIQFPKQVKGYKQE